MTIMKTTAKWLSGIILLAVIIYLSGPQPSKPDFTTPDFNLPGSLAELEKMVNESESAVKGLRPGNEARIVWADTAVKQKTKVAILYLHGFSASQAEGEPVHRNLAKKYNANLYLSRLSEHGIDAGDSTMINLTAENYFISAERALEITKRIGDEVIVIGTSAGGALTLFLASRHPEIKAIVLYSPCVALYDKGAAILDNPWGLQVGRKVKKGLTAKFEPSGEDHARNWVMEYRLEALVALQDLVTNTMKAETFEKVMCPVFLAYYYKNEEEQDKTVSVPAMLEMFEQLGTPPDMKRKMAFPETGAHVIASYIRSKDWHSVQNETDKFLSEIVKP